MIYLNYLKPNTKTNTYEAANYFGTDEKMNLRLGIIIIKSYSHAIDEIAADLSISLGT